MEKEDLTNHLTTLILRLPVGILFLLAGIWKLRNPALFTGFIHKDFDATFLGGPLLGLFILLLPYVEAAVGLLLVAGLFTRLGLIGAAVTLVVLFLGKAVVQDYATCAQITIYIFVTVFALRSAEQNQFSVDALLARRGK